MTDVKLMDRVKVTGNCNGLEFTSHLGTVVEDSAVSDNVGVDFDVNIHGHSCGGRAKDGYGFYVPRRFCEVMPLMMTGGRYEAVRKVLCEQGPYVDGNVRKLIEDVVDVLFGKDTSKESEVRFQVGDIIQAVSPQDGCPVTGLLGVIVSLRVGLSWAVEFFDKFTGAHTCNDQVLSGYGLFMNEGNMKRVYRMDAKLKEKIK